mgnify:CR=1 FL=1
MMESKCRIGPFIILVDERNKDGHDYPVLGINKDKTFMPTAANMAGIDTSKYKIVRKDTFVFSGMQTGRDVCIRIGLYNEDTPALVSPAYTTFRLDTEKGIVPEFFFLNFNRDESDRYGAFISDSSVRANLDWNRFLEIEIPLPPIAEQQKVVNAWKALREIKEQNEEIAAPLMQVCQSYIQELKHKYECVEIGPYIIRFDDRNADNKIKIVKSVSVTKEFNDTNAKVDKSNLRTYKIVCPNQISFVQTTGNEKCLCAAINHFGYPIVVTSVNEVFETNQDILNPDYLHMWFRRKELDRYTRFHSWGSARETFTWEDMKRVRIPLPPLSVQQAIVNIYNCANEAKKIAEKADRMSREVCPALIQHVINNN